MFLTKFLHREHYATAHAGDFRHVWCQDNVATLVEKIDRHFGGWPVIYNQLGFDHSESRIMTFAKNRHNDGWWTCVMTDKDYYRFKCGAAAPEDFRLLQSALSYLTQRVNAVVPKSPSAAS